MTEMLQALMRRDWGEVLVGGVAIILSLSFVMASRAIPEMIALTSSAISGSEYGYADSSNGRLFLLSGVPAGLLAKRWTTAIILMVVGYATGFYFIDRWPEEPDQWGMVAVGLAFYTLFSGGLVRMVRVMFDTQRIAKKWHAKLDRGTLSSIAAIALALSGFWVWGKINDEFPVSESDALLYNAVEADNGTIVINESDDNYPGNPLDGLKRRETLNYRMPELPNVDDIILERPESLSTETQKAKPIVLPTQKSSQERLREIYPDLPRLNNQSDTTVINEAE